MDWKILRLLVAVWLTSTSLAQAVEITTVKPPPPAQLIYKAHADVRGIVLEGESEIDWRWDAKHYQLSLETRAALTGVLLADSSEGGFDRNGLAPDSYTARRFMKNKSVARFDRVAGEIDFAGDGTAYKLKGGEQDRISVLWQLLSMMRARPADFKPGTRKSFYVAGHRGGDAWTFEVKEKSRLRSAFGNIETLHVAYIPEDKSTKTQVDVWFAPSQDWFPVRIRFSEPNGDYIDQTLEQVNRR
jgi:hypothetical protein